MDKVFQDEYTERASYGILWFYVLTFLCEGDLEGLKVSHDFDEMDEGEARILTLKDSRILDNEGIGYLIQEDNPFINIFVQRMSYRTSRWLRPSVLGRLTN